MKSFDIIISKAETAADLAAAAALFKAYAKSLPIDLSYQDFSAELASLPGKYAPPRGALFLGRNANNQALGCVALRPMNDDCCEMKRLYIVPSARGLGLGKVLVTAILSEAARLGYGEVRLDTLPSMASALALYAGVGFRHIPAYYNTPIAGTVFLAKRISQK
jgi:ribosomal protein S18 acetylase RimI-like enzyme